MKIKYLHTHRFIETYGFTFDITWRDKRICGNWTTSWAHRIAKFLHSRKDKPFIFVKQ